MKKTGKKAEWRIVLAVVVGVLLFVVFLLTVVLQVEYDQQKKEREHRELQRKYWYR